MDISASEKTMTMPKKGDDGMISSASISKLMKAEVPGNPTHPRPHTPAQAVVPWPAVPPLQPTGRPGRVARALREG